MGESWIMLLAPLIGGTGLLLGVDSGEIGTACASVKPGDACRGSSLAGLTPLSAGSSLLGMLVMLGSGSSFPAASSSAHSHHHRMAASTRAQSVGITVHDGRCLVLYLVPRPPLV